MIAQKTLTPRATAELGLLGLVWGTSFLAIRVALDEVPVLTWVAWRVAPAAAALWLWVVLQRLPVPRQPRVWTAFLVMGLLNNALPFTLMARAKLHIETGLTAILNATTATFGVVCAALAFGDERLTARKAMGMALGLAGVVAAVRGEARAPGAFLGLGLLAAGLALLDGRLPGLLWRAREAP